MTKITPFIIFLLSLFITISILISSSSALISDKRLCYDEHCSEPISLAKTLTTYFSNDKNILSFKSNIDVIIFSKSAGKRQDLWGVEILGKRGYVPKNLIRETTILKKQLSFEVPTESTDENVKPEVTQEPQVNKTTETVDKLLETPDSNQVSENAENKPEVSVINSSAEDVEHSIPNLENVSPRYEVVDGTTIPLVIDEVTQDFNLPAIEDATPEEPVLSVHPHPSLVSSTISFVSKLFDKGEKEVETDKAGEENEAGETEKEAEAEISKEEVKIETVTEEVKEKDEQVINEENEEEKDEDSEEEIEEEEENEKENLQEEKIQENVTTKPEDNSDSVETQVKETETKENDEKEEKIVEESIEENNEVIYESPTQVENSNIVNNNETAEEPNVPVVDNKVSENVSFPEDVSVDDDNKTGKIVTDQVPLSDTRETFKLEENTVNEILDKKTELEAEPAIESVVGENFDNQIYNISITESPDSASNASESIVENNKDVNIVNSENIPQENNINTENIPQENINTENIPLENINRENIPQENINTENIPQGNINSENIPQEDINTENIANFQATNIGDFVKKEVNSFEEKVEENVVFDNNNNVSVEQEIILKNDTATLESLEPHFHDEVEPQKEILTAESVSSFNELPSNRNLLNIDEQFNSQESLNEESTITEIPRSIVSEEIVNKEEKSKIEELFDKEDLEEMSVSRLVLPPEVCEKDSDCPKENVDHIDDNAVTYVVKMGTNYWEFLAYLLITSVTILIFSLGYYYIENARRDNQLIAKINKLEKELMVSTKECALLNENLTCTKTKLNSIEDESFGSNEMVASLKADLSASQNAKLDLEDQVATLEKELESAAEAGLELERMLREFLSSNNEDNPLAQSIEDLQARLNAQQAENEALTNALNLKKQESEALSSDLVSFTTKYQELELEVKRLEEELKTQGNMKIYMEQNLEDKIQRLEMQIGEIMEERSQLRKGLKAKELEISHLLEVVDQDNSNNLDFDKLYDSIQAKAEALQLAEERDELRLKIKEAENVHKLLEAHVKSAKEKVISLIEECKVYEKEKKDAETKLEVLSNFFNEKEAQRQKEEAVWLEKQGEVSSTVERIHTMQNEIQNYKQQIEILKREIVEQEREYKSQIGALETKAHEHWVVARQNERRLEELKAESGQLRNRLTIVEKSMNDPDPDVKLHRMDANGETVTSPSLFLGPESSSSPIMFSNSSGVPPPPPPSHYMFGPPPYHPYLPPPPPGPGGLPPFDVGQRPPPLGGRLSSPPPLPLQPPSGRYENNGSPPPLSPPLPHHHFGRHRSPPPPFSNDRMHHSHPHSHPPPPPSLLPIPLLGSSHNWGEEPLPPLRNSGFHPHQRDQRSRNHKGSLHSSGESLDKSHHSGKV